MGSAPLRFSMLSSEKAEITNIIVVSTCDKNKSFKIAQNRKDQYGKDLFKDIF